MNLKMKSYVDKDEMQLVKHYYDSININTDNIFDICIYTVDSNDVSRFGLELYSSGLYEKGKYRKDDIIPADNTPYYWHDGHPQKKY